MKVTERGLLVVGTSALLVTALVLLSTASNIPEEAENVIGLTLWPPGFMAAGAIITGRFPRHAVGRLLMWAGFSAGVIFAFQAAGVYTGVDPAELGGAAGVAAGVLGGLWWVPIVLLFAAIARFPDGEWTTPWVARLFWLGAVGFALEALLVAFFGIDEGLLASLSGVAWSAMMVLIIVTLVRGDPVRRRQFAWVALGLTASLVMQLVPIPDGGLSVWAGPALLLIFPASLVVAITRYRLYEIDRIVSRTVTYVVVIGALVLVYAGLVLVLRSLLPVEGPLPVALSTLAVAFAFFPLARWVQGWVDRRFFRSRYDAAVVVAAFADELRTTLDPSVAAGRAEAVVAETFQAESVAVWLAEEPA